MNLHVLVPSFNCAGWIERCLQSVAGQNVAPASVLVIDDASTEPGYSELALEACGRRGYSFLRNATNRKCPYNLWRGIPLLDAAPDDVIFLLDGDDFLPDPTVFTQIAEVYADPSIWLSYGNYAPFPRDTGQTPATAYPPDVVARRAFRSAGSLFNHPLTFRQHLWDALSPADMKTDDGRWYRGGYDRAIMIPMLEMSAPDHFRFLDRNLYSYNAVNPISDSLVNAVLIDETADMWARPAKAPHQW